MKCLFSAGGGGGPSSERLFPSFNSWFILRFCLIPSLIFACFSRQFDLGFVELPAGDEDEALLPPVCLPVWLRLRLPEECLRTDGREEPGDEEMLFRGPLHTLRCFAMRLELKLLPQLFRTYHGFMFVCVLCELLGVCVRCVRVCVHKKTKTRSNLNLVHSIRSTLECSSGGDTSTAISLAPPYTSSSPLSSRSSVS